MKPLLVIIGLSLMAGAEAHPALGALIAQSALGLALVAAAVMRP